MSENETDWSLYSSSLHQNDNFIIAIFVLVILFVRIDVLGSWITRPPKRLPVEFYLEKYLFINSQLFITTVLTTL